MPDTRPPVVTTPEGSLNVDLRGVHYDFLKQRIPDWFLQAPQARQEELARHELTLPDWYLTASAQAKEALAASHAKYRESLNTIEHPLGAIDDVLAFARGRLKDEIARQFKLEVDVDNAYFARKYAPARRNDLSGFFVFDQQSDDARHHEYRGSSLLETALANFEPGEEKPLRCTDCHVITTWNPQGSDIIPTFYAINSQALPIAPDAFARLCRKLDLGKQYQAHIRGIVQPAGNAERNALEQQLQEHHRQRLALSVEIAHSQRSIGPDVYQALQQVLTGKPGATLDGKPLTFTALKVFDRVLVGPLLIGPDRINSQGIERVVAYIPDDPEQPLKEYASSSHFMRDLRARLHKVAYRRFFSRFIPVRDQGLFFRRFNGLYKPANRSDAQTDYPLASRPSDLPMADVLIDNDDLWVTLRKAQVSKILGDARAIAVPTEDEDRQARIRRLEAYKDAVISVLNLAAFVVPGLGPLMLVVGAAQMCGDVFEGIEAYEDGDTRQMWAHFSSVALNVGMIATGAKVLPAINKFPLVEGMRPVTLANGKQALWNPDLAPYALPEPLPDNLAPDAQGLYQHGGKTILALDGKPYQVVQEADSGQYRIQHPTRAEAYAPALEHNAAGAWNHEAEEPLTWDESTLYRRMGIPNEPHLARISGVETDALRQAFIEREPAPLLMGETLRRFQIHRDLTAFVEQMNSPHAAEYAKADPALQLHIMQRRGMLPSGVTLRVIDRSAQVLWESPALVPDTPQRVVLVAQRADLLRDVLYTLQGIDPDLSEIPGSPQDSLVSRASQLRHYIADQVESLKGALINERYRKLSSATALDSNVRRVLNIYPDLPTSVASHLLEDASAEALLSLRETGRLPDELAEKAQWCVEELRVARAYEGLYQDVMSDLDTLRLALRTLETLPGWPRGARVELRQYSASGPLLDAIGLPDAAAVRTLVLMENGLFQAATPGRFYAAAWEQLRPVERQGLSLNDAQQLEDAIKQAPLPREALRSVLLEHPIRRPASNPALRLLGGTPGFRQLMTQAGNVFQSPQASVRKLFPTFTDAQVNAFIQGLGTDVRGGLARWQTEYASLEKQLKIWVKANRSASDEWVARRAEGWAQRSSREILRCWRRETGTALRLSFGTPPLPALRANFSHIRTLELNYVTWTASADAFLSNFSSLERLSVISSGLTELPGVIDELPNLTLLQLRSNNIRLTASSAEKLSALSHLETLNLSGNPLEVLPDFSGMSRLEQLDLSGTRIAQWPSGLQDLTRLQHVNLKHNNLREVPQAYLNPAAEQMERVARINGVTLLDGNPFPADYWQEFDRYWQRLAVELPEQVQAAHAQAFYCDNPRIRIVQKLYPKYTSVREARAFTWTLGEQADAELVRREHEFDGLVAQLDAWSFTGGGARQRYVRVNALQRNAAALDDRYIARQRILSCWRRESPQQFAFDGTPIGLELDLSNLRLPSLPDLDANFSHVGSLKLRNLHLSTSPEGFLSGFRGLRWLDMTENQLRDLPPVLGEMNGLTRLFLSKNQLRLTPETAQMLSERVTLRALALSDNPLGIAPDFSRMTDLRTVTLRNTGLTQWPAGLLERPLWTQLLLDNNQISTLPDALIAPTDDGLATTTQISNWASVTHNPLSEVTLQRVRDYGERLHRSGLADSPTSNSLVASALNVRRQATVTSGAPEPFLRWTANMSEDQIATRRAQWQSLRGQAGADGFFNMLRDLPSAQASHPDLQRRVWEVIDCMTEHTAEAETLRQQMFEWAGRAACCDRAALSFSNAEVMTLVHKAQAQAVDPTQGDALLALSKGIFRLDEVEKVALADIQQREAAIDGRSDLTAAQKSAAKERLEDVEIKLAYRYGLKDRLGLPGQPSQVRFTQLADVSQAMLDAAYDKIVALDNSPHAFQALVSREFWRDFVTSKYRPQFEAQSQPFQKKMANLHADFTAHKLSHEAYVDQANTLQAQLAIEEGTLIETLTRQEWLTHQPTEQASTDL